MVSAAKNLPTVKLLNEWSSLVHVAKNKCHVMVGEGASRRSISGCSRSSDVDEILHSLFVTCSTLDIRPILSILNPELVDSRPGCIMD